MYQLIAIGAGLAAVTQRQLIAHQAEEKMIPAVTTPVWL
jgi:hypothetical protein